MAARAASNPPIWEIAATTLMMFGLTAVEVWIAGRAFRTGALASGRFDLKLLLGSVLRGAQRA
jgi:ABC-2 type transport system permease protein